ADAPPGGLRAATRARIDLLPYQLEPCLAILRGRASRVLLADEVGLGKTIQAGLIVSELSERAGIDRVLILTPPGLRDQWRDELQRRFALDPSIVDARAIVRRAADLPPDVNPWTTIPMAIASIELVKRTEVLAAAAAADWDLVVVDEAHGAATDSDRHRAVQAICSRAAYVLLITATPHSGDQRAYQSLLDLGSSGDKPLVFRRSRSHVGLGGERRVHVITVRRRMDERRMDDALAAYAVAVERKRPDSWLALSVLHKRALSSAWSLAESVDRRLAALDASADRNEDQQLPLPLVDRDGDFNADDQPPPWPDFLSLDDPIVERRLLTTLAAAARRASLHESKIAVVQRLLRRRRMAGERLIVFTEYRDTLERIRRTIGGRGVVLHGGMDRLERTRALERFGGEAGSVLLATDAAGEGLNLHDGCRFVVNLELPWNPMRLEQRIGRVDRIGQRRRVHVWHLVAASTGEPRILERLRARVAAARTAIDVADPLGRDEERAVARLVVTGRSSAADPATAAIDRSETRDAAAAIREVERIGALRRFADAEPVWRAAGPLIHVSRRSHLRVRLGTDALMLWRVAAEDAAGRIVECRLVPVLVRGSWPRRPWTRARLLALVAAVEADVRSRIAILTMDWRDEAIRIDAAFRAERIARTRAIADIKTPPPAYQAGLFDRRAERAVLAAAALHRARAHDASDRIATLERPILTWPIDLAVMLVVR
ncbi:MAG TPA: helicase-related protein, partial [Vicinamibacterales bacterium]